MPQKRTTLPVWKRPSGKYKAFVLAIKDHKNKNEFSCWNSISTKMIATGLVSKGYEVIPYFSEDVDKIPISLETPVRGGANSFQTVLKRLGIKLPNVDIPDFLWNSEEFIGRKIQVGTIKDLKRFKSFCGQSKVHVKPYEIQKAFKGKVIDLKELPNLLKSFSITQILKEDYHLMKNFSDNFKLLMQEHIEIKNEIRFFVSNNSPTNEVEEQQNNFVVIPEFFSMQKHFFNESETTTTQRNFVHKLAGYLRMNNFSMKNYVVDVAINAKTNQPCLVEINDPITSGCGFITSEKEFTNIFLERWFEITDDKLRKENKL